MPVDNLGLVATIILVYCQPAMCEHLKTAWLHKKWSMNHVLSSVASRTTTALAVIFQREFKMRRYGAVVTYRPQKPHIRIVRIYIASTAASEHPDDRPVEPPDAVV